MTQSRKKMAQFLGQQEKLQQKCKHTRLEYGVCLDCGARIRPRKSTDLPVRSGK